MPLTLSSNFGYLPTLPTVVFKSTTPSLVTEDNTDCIYKGHLSPSSQICNQYQRPQRSTPCRDGSASWSTTVSYLAFWSALAVALLGSWREEYFLVPFAKLRREERRLSDSVNESGSVNESDSVNQFDNKNEIDRKYLRFTKGGLVIYCFLKQKYRVKSTP